MSDILRRARLVNREIFDPTNEAHVDSLKTFLRTGSWGEIQFWPEVPYTEAPATVMAKFARHSLGVTQETAVERTERLVTRGVTQPTEPETKEEYKARLTASNVRMKERLSAMNAS